MNLHLVERNSTQKTEWVKDMLHTVCGIVNNGVLLNRQHLSAKLSMILDEQCNVIDLDDRNTESKEFKTFDDCIDIVVENKLKFCFIWLLKCIMFYVNKTHLILGNIF